MTRPETERRRALVLELRAQKLSWRAIGKRVGITGARCQQIATNYRKSREPKPITIRSYLRERVREAEAHAELMIRLLGVE